MTAGLTTHERTARKLRMLGWRVATVETYVAGGMRKRDAFGIFDLIAIKPGRIVGIQACIRSAKADHLRKIQHEHREDAVAWLKAGGEIQFWLWNRPEGSRTFKIQVFSFSDDLDPIEIENHLT